MRIAIPTAEGKLALHFGHCTEFAMIDVDVDKGAILATDAAAPPPHAPGVLPQWLKQQGVDLVIAGGMGSRAQGLFAESGVQVVVGAPVDTPENLVNAYLRQELETSDNVCDH